MQRPDLLISLGARFDDRVTGKVAAFAPEALVVHVDIDPAEIGKVRRPDVAVVADCRRVIEALVEALAEGGHARGGATRPLVGQLAEWQARYPSPTTPVTGRQIEPQYVVEELRAATARTTRSTSPGSASTRCGRRSSRASRSRAPGSTPAASARWASPCRRRWAPRSGRPDAEVWAIDGDGCFQMTNQELATCAIEGIPVKIAIINNGNLGMVRQWQTLFYNERYSNTDLGDTKAERQGTRIPDFVKLAEAYGCVGLRCERKEDVDAIIEQAMAINDRPVVIDFIVARGRDGVAHGRGRHQQRRHQVRARHGPTRGLGG